MSALAPNTLAPPTPIRAGCALFLDIDGCLLDFADHPEAVHVPDGLRDHLAALHAALDGAVAFVSGRAIEQVDALFAPLVLPAGGLHGLELRHAGGARADTVSAPTELQRVHAAALQVAQQYPGARVEDKGVALALHWRAAPNARSPLQAIAASALGHLPGYRLQHGNCVVELRPEGTDKGAAVAKLMQTSPFAGRVPVYAGDDLTDEDAFVAVNALDGESIIVGDRRPTHAQLALQDTHALRTWLAEGAHRLGAHA